MKNLFVVIAGLMSFGVAVAQQSQTACINNCMRTAQMQQAQANCPQPNSMQSAGAISNCQNLNILQCQKQCQSGAPSLDTDSSDSNSDSTSPHAD